MSSTKVRELQILLDDVMPYVEVVMGGVGEFAQTVDNISTYRRDLFYSRHSWHGGVRFHSMIYRPGIRDTGMQKRLMSVIRNDLAPYLDGDNLQTATIIAEGGIIEGFDVKSILQNLLDSAILYGTGAAARQFYEQLDGKRLDYLRVTLLTGLRIEGTIEINDRIRLVPLSDNSADLPIFLPKGGSDLAPRHFMGRTVLIRDHSVSPKFVNPKQISPSSLFSAFKHTEPRLEDATFSVDDFCEALSLVTNKPVQMVAEWSYFNQDEIFRMHNWPNSSMWYSSEFFQFSKSPVADEEAIENAVGLYRARQRLRPNDADQLRVSVRRWIKSMAQNDLVDAFIDLGIAMESLYLQNVRDELRFRLALHAAWHLERDTASRQELMDKVRKVYDRRSTAVHAGKLDGNDATLRMKDEAQQICRRSILKVIEEGGYPDWDQLVVGGIKTC